MRPIAEIRERLRRLVFRSRVDRELDEEIRFHLEMEADRLVQSGLEPDEAHRRAALAFGGVEHFKAETREAFGMRWLEDAVQDLRFAVRSLGRRPGFALAVLAILAVGIGGTTAVYSVVRSVLVEPLPWDRPEQLVRLYQVDEEEPDKDLFVSGPHFVEYRENAESFQGLATVYTYEETGADLSVGTRAERVRVLPVSAGYFELMRIEPLVGRTFAREDEAGAPLVILSESLRRRLGNPPPAPGDRIEIDGEPRTIVGVMPEGTEDPLVGTVDLWIPQNLQTAGAQFPGNHFLSVIGRLAPGVTPEEARQEMAALDRALAQKYPEVADDARFRLVPLKEDLVARARPALLLLLGAVGLVLLIACANVANLLIVRSLGRKQEVAIRSALGARPGRLARQFLTESLLLAAAGGAAGVAVAWGGLRVLLTAGRQAIPRVAEAGLDGPVLGFTALVALLTGIVFGLAPVLRHALTPPGAAMRESSRGASEERTGWGRRILVISQVALAFILLVGASVLGASIYRIVGLDLGIRTANVLTFELNLPTGRYDGARRASFHRETTSRLGGLPGVTAVGATSWLPATGSGYNWGTLALSGPLAGSEEWLGTEQRIVAGEFFRALEIPLLQGRVFDGRDEPDAPPVAVVSESVATSLFPGVSPLGHRIRMGGVEREIVGVVGDIAIDEEARTAPHVYHAQPQYPDRNWAMTYLVASESDPRALLPAVRSEVAAIDPQLVVHAPVLLEEILAIGHSQRRFTFVLGAAFAGVALLLSVLGLYGVIAYLVGQRQRELSIRLALGANPSHVVGLVLRHGASLIGAGLAVGFLGAMALHGALESITFRTDPADPRILAAVVITLVLCGIAACLIPAYRAVRVPLRAALVQE